MAENIFDSHLQHDVHFSSFSFTFPAKFPTSSECPCQIAPAALFKCHISHKQLLKLFTCTTRTRTPSDRLVWIINWLKCFSFSPLWFPFFFLHIMARIIFHINERIQHAKVPKMVQESRVVQGKGQLPGGGWCGRQTLVATTYHLG